MISELCSSINDFNLNEININTPDLTVEQVITQTHVKHNDIWNFRHRGDLFWSEKDNVVSLEGRVEFINKVSARILEIFPLKDTPITLVSLEAGGLLTEAYINERLVNLGYNNLSWRVIDFTYHKSYCQDVFREFKNSVNENIRVFTTEQAYFNKRIGDISLADGDKVQGKTVILNQCPPTIKSHVGYDSDCMLVKGWPLDHVDKANAIYVMIIQRGIKNLLTSVRDLLSGGQTLVAVNNMARCSLDKKGSCIIRCSPSDKGNFIQNKLQEIMASDYNTAKTAGKTLALSDIDKYCGDFLTCLSGSDLTGIKYYVSDCDVSRIKLYEHFNEGENSVIMASFDNDETSFGLQE